MPDGDTVLLLEINFYLHFLPLPYLRNENVPLMKIGSSDKLFYSVIRSMRVNFIYFKVIEC